MIIRRYEIKDALNTDEFLYLEIEKIMHPKTLFILLVSLLLQNIPSFSQSKLLKGQVIVHNSKSETGRVKFVPDTKITSLVAGRVHTDSKGRFKLKLKNIDPNEPLFLQVEKEGYEVVNLRDIKYVLFDQKSWLRILVAEKGYVKRVRNALIVSAKETLKKEQTQLLEQIQVNGNAMIPVLENRFGRRIFSTREANRLLSEWSKKVEKNIRYCSYELVIVNPDDASDLYLSAMSHYRQGDFEMAVKTLQKEKVEKSARNLIAAIEKLGDNQIQINRLLENKLKNIDRIKNNYIFQIIALQQSFRLREAALAMRKLEKINEVAMTRKHREIIERLNSFKVDEAFMIDENVLLKENPNPVFTETNNRNDILRKSTTPQFQQNATPQVQQYYTAPQIQSNTFQKERLENPYQVSSSQPRYQPRENLEYRNTQVGNQTSPVAERNTSREKMASYIPVTNARLKNDDQPNVSHSVVNNGSTITITTTISTDPNGAVKVNTDINESNPTSIMTETIPQVPNSYNHLTAKGGMIPTEESKNNNDFETVIFPVENTSKQFESFIEIEKKDEPKQWTKSNKYR